MDEWLLVLGAVFIVLQGFFSGSETAYVVANPVRVAHLSRKTRRQEQAIELLKNPELLLVMTLICTNIAVVLSGFFITTYFVDKFETLGTALAIIVGSLAGLLFGDYLPKTSARMRAERMVISTAGFFSVGVLLTKPFRKLFKRPKFSKLSGERLSITRPDMLTALKLGEKIGSIEEKTSPRVANLFKAFDTPLADVMIPWDRVTTLPENVDRKQILKAITEHGFTRYPVVRDNEQVIGIIHTKDLLHPTSKLRKPFFTRPGVRITELLKTMQNLREHIAVVLDINDKPIGLVTLEDLLEEFIGEIRSEE